MGQDERPLNGMRTSGLYSQIRPSSSIALFLFFSAARLSSVGFSFTGQTCLRQRFLFQLAYPTVPVSQCEARSVEAPTSTKDSTPRRTWALLNQPIGRFAGAEATHSREEGGCPPRPPCPRTPCYTRAVATPLNVPCRSTSTGLQSGDSPEPTCGRRNSVSGAIRVPISRHLQIQKTFMFLQ